MNVDRLAAPPPFPPGAAPAGNATQDLHARLQGALETPPTPPPPGEEEDPADAIKRFIYNLYANQFMSAMLFEDEEKTGVKPDPWY
ncbi:hypothetical protein [Stenotrophomonas sp.]|uniref:hypothetical protein n=1 Tax=Stenotrophomonas sp. TaxID=69392 RepID=UPI002FCAC6FA